MRARHTVRGRSSKHEPVVGHRAGSAVRSALSWLAGTVALTAAIVALGAAPALLAGAPARAFAATTVKVGPCDTLWSIAEGHRLPGASTAETVEAIRQANAMSGSALAAGVVLRVPAVAASDSAYADAGEIVAR